MTSSPFLIFRILLLYFTLGGGVFSLSAQTFNNDYFDPLRDQKLLNTNEQYHLSKGTFYKHFREGSASGNLQLAIAELEFILRYWPNHPNALLFIASIAKMKNDPNLADQYFRKALHLFPQHAITHGQYGHFLVEVGRIEEGINHLHEAIQMNEQLMVAYEWLGEAYNLQGDSKRAKEAIAKANHLRKNQGEK
ncbi:tetratricopeptide repeat protein [Candidatus Nitrospira neomarina]|uniref:Tetratricopeptide repeat protein n=1 Tax=Candidatus Nitrospira neomarina TaxID=3020899 RepID=A0AA96GPG1_9BACT|nr:tetratricopeptide repeat protein [Candidatus Nitrospira neomarina]WNM63980.1 tetratricopeptide repeat protein [Candidatus Nitrospira neomarina]